MKREKEIPAKIVEFQSDALELKEHLEKEGISV